MTEVRRKTKEIDMEPREWWDQVEEKTDDSPREDSPLTPAHSPPSSQAEPQTPTGSKKISSDNVRKTFPAISFKKLQYIMCLHALGTTALPHEDKMDRQEELQNFAARRAASVIAAIIRGKMARKRDVAEAERAARVTRAAQGMDDSAVAFKNHFMKIMSSPDEQVRLLDEDGNKQQARTHTEYKASVEDTEYIASENELSEHNPLYESEPAVTAASLTEPEATDEGSLKMKNVFQERIKLRKEAREKRAKDKKENKNVTTMDL